MSTNSINDYYNKIISNYITNTGKVSNTNSNSGNQGSSSSANSLTDSLDLSSNVPDLAEYLNYGSSGQYSGTPSLADLLGSNQDGSLSDLLGSSQDSGLSDLLGSSDTSGSDQTSGLSGLFDDSSDSSDGSSFDNAFTKLADLTASYNNLLITQALNRLKASGTKTPDGSNDNTTQAIPSSNGNSK
ncbi:MAG: hypothetical protein Q8920_08595 [Bacillota bacterium]|nr:hypothetical protein [Bacillota bacterium]